MADVTYSDKLFMMCVVLGAERAPVAGWPDAIREKYILDAGCHLPQNDTIVTTPSGYREALIGLCHEEGADRENVETWTIDQMETYCQNHAIPLPIVNYDLSNTIERNGDGDGSDSDGGIEKDIKYWADKLQEVQVEARAHGVSSIAILVYNDHLDDAEDKVINFNGAGPVMMLGMAEYLKHMVLVNLEKTTDIP